MHVPSDILQRTLGMLPFGLTSLFGVRVRVVPMIWQDTHSNDIVFRSTLPVSSSEKPEVIFDVNVYDESNQVKILVRLFELYQISK